MLDTHLDQELEKWGLKREFIKWEIINNIGCGPFVDQNK
jgi:hypothetical protein